MPFVAVKVILLEISDVQPEFENKHCKELEEGFREYLHYANLVQNISTEREEVHHHSENHFELMEGINEVENVPFEEIFENEAILNENQGNIQVVNNLIILQCTKIFEIPDLIMT